MRYLLLVATDTEPDTDPAPSLDAAEWVRQIGDKWVFGDRLRPPEDGTTVRVRSAEVDVQKGPFTNSREQIVGFDVLDCADMAEAIEIVAKHPNARTGRIELRPFWPLDQG